MWLHFESPCSSLFWARRLKMFVGDFYLKMNHLLGFSRNLSYVFFSFHPNLHAVAVQAHHFQVFLFSHSVARWRGETNLTGVRRGLETENFITKIQFSQIFSTTMKYLHKNCHEFCKFSDSNSTFWTKKQFCLLGSVQVAPTCSQHSSRLRYYVEFSQGFSFE